MVTEGCGIGCRPLTLNYWALRRPGAKITYLYTFQMNRMLVRWVTDHFLPGNPPAEHGHRPPLFLSLHIQKSSSVYQRSPSRWPFTVVSVYSSRPPSSGCGNCSFNIMPHVSSCQTGHYSHQERISCDCSSFFLFFFFINFR